MVVIDNLMLYTGIFLVTLIVGMDLIIRKKQFDDARVKVFELFSLFILLVYLIVATRNFAMIAVAGTTILSLGWAFRELLANMSSTFFLHMNNPYKKNDILDVEKQSGLKFDRIGFLRSKMINATGATVYVPNRTLLNDIVAVTPAK